MKVRVQSALWVVLVMGAPLAAQAPESPPPTKEHQWLKHFEGQWETESEGAAGPGQPPMKCKGEMTGKTLGGYWVICQYKADMMGTKMEAMQTVGFDPIAKKFVGTWVDSMMNHMWKYDGALDKSGKTLTLGAEGPNFTAPGKTAKFRDVYTMMNQDHITIKSEMQGDDGKWITFMTGHMRRRKA